MWVKKLMLGSRDRESIRQRASQYALDLVRRLTAGLPLRLSLIHIYCRRRKEDEASS